MDKIYSIAIIGGGAAGVMAVNRALLNNDSCLFFSGGNKEKKKSRGLWVKKVENVPGHLNYKRGITEPNDEMINWLKQSSFKDNLTHLSKSVIQIQKKNEDNIFELIDENQKVYYCKYVVLCTGIMDVQPKIGGSIQPILPYANSQQVEYCLRCDGHHILGKHTAVFGHSSAAAWVTIMLHERYQPPSLVLLTNGQDMLFNEEEKKLLLRYKISIHTEEISKILDDGHHKLLGVEFISGKTLKFEICFVSLGTIVYNKLALQLGAKSDERGYILTDDFGQSSVDRLYIAGDLRSGKKKQIYTAWDTAVDALDQINARIRIEKRLEE